MLEFFSELFMTKFDWLLAVMIVGELHVIQSSIAELLINENYEFKLVWVFLRQTIPQVSCSYFLPY